MPKQHPEKRNDTFLDRLKTRIEAALLVARLVKVSLSIFVLCLTLPNELTMFWYDLERLGFTASFIS